MNKIFEIPPCAEPWLVYLIELKNRSGKTIHDISTATGFAEKSIQNVFSGKSKNPGIDLVVGIIHALGGKVADVLGESGAVIGGKDLATLQKEVDILIEERDLLLTELNRLKDDYAYMRRRAEEIHLELDATKDELLKIYRERAKQ